jgi:hypothetical protein
MTIEKFCVRAVIPQHHEPGLAVEWITLRKSALRAALMPGARCQVSWLQLPAISHRPDRDLAGSVLISDPR